MVEGLFYSQVGYDAGYPVRALICGSRERLGRPAFTLRDAQGAIIAEGRATYWGSKWGREWWIVQLPLLAEGSYRLQTYREDGSNFRSGEIEVANDLLWRKTLRAVAIEQARTRAERAPSGAGWLEDGPHRQPVWAHALFLLGLEDVLAFSHGKTSHEEHSLVEDQVVNGCRYLMKCQEKSAQLRKPRGSLVFDLTSDQEILLPQDAVKAAAALGRAGLLLSKPTTPRISNHPREAFRYGAQCQPVQTGFSATSRGIKGSFTPPVQWPTRELFMQAYAAMELSLGDIQFREDFVTLASVIAHRQIPPDKAEAGLFGHFLEFAGHGHSEKLWSHHMEDGQIGVDFGATVPFITCLILACDIWGDHRDARMWREMIEDFAYGYFRPACQSNPFNIIPRGYFPGEGLLNFAGLWHGMNGAYGMAAGLAVALSQFLRDRSFIDIAVGNLQWIAGLNIGALCHASDPGVQEALPISMICGVGQRHVGGEGCIPGSICHGFAAGEQCLAPVTPTVEADAKVTLSEQASIVHSAGWLSGLSRLVSLES